MCIFGECMHVQFAEMQYAHKIMKIISSPNSAKMLSFVIILLLSSAQKRSEFNILTSFNM